MIVNEILRSRMFKWQYYLCIGYKVDIIVQNCKPFCNKLMTVFIYNEFLHCFVYERLVQKLLWNAAMYDFIEGIRNRSVIDFCFLKVGVTACLSNFCNVVPFHVWAKKRVFVFNEVFFFLVYWTSFLEVSEKINNNCCYHEKVIEIGNILHD